MSEQEIEETSGPELGEMPSQDLGVERAEASTPEKPIKALCVETAFLVYMKEDGSYFADVNLSQPLMTAREANLNDLYRAAVEIQRDIDAGITAMKVQDAMQRAAQQALGAAAAQQAMAAAAQHGAPVAGGVLLNPNAHPNRQQRRHPNA
jgi:hypothetical protein